jgi:hypothetical protein
VPPVDGLEQLGGQVHDEPPPAYTGCDRHRRVARLEQPPDRKAHALSCSLPDRGQAAQRTTDIGPGRLKTQSDAVREITCDDMITPEPGALHLNPFRGSPKP